jgi:hypothetical protein
MPPRPATEPFQLVDASTVIEASSSKAYRTQRAHRARSSRLHGSPTEIIDCKAAAGDATGIATEQRAKRTSCFRVVRGVVETQQHIDAATRANRPIGAFDPVASDRVTSGY